jgi:hypothetical protein
MRLIEYLLTLYTVKVSEKLTKTYINISVNGLKNKRYNDRANINLRH